LFTLAGSVEARLLEKNAGCVRFTMPPSVDTGGIQQITTAGETFTNLPSNPTIATNLSPFGDYLLTGSINSQGNQCMLDVEIQTSCSRKTVTRTYIKFRKEKHKIEE